MEKLQGVVGLWLAEFRPGQAEVAEGLGAEIETGNGLGSAEAALDGRDTIPGSRPGRSSAARRRREKLNTHSGIRGGKISRPERRPDRTDGEWQSGRTSPLSACPPTHLVSSSAFTVTFWLSGG